VNRATPTLKRFASRLLDYESSRDKPAIQVAIAFRVCEKLREPLGTLMGMGGFRALLRRALVLAQAEVAWLKRVQVKEDGSLEGLSEVETKLSQEEIREGEIILVAHFFGLLVTFIGEALMSSLVGSVWPEGSFGDLNEKL
jgi:hypothetical protein